MVSDRKEKTASWWPLAVIVVLQIIVLQISPEERTLGGGIKPVYLHVSLTWTGMIFLAVNGLLGLAAAVLSWPIREEPVRGVARLSPAEPTA